MHQPTTQSPETALVPPWDGIRVEWRKRKYDALRHAVPLEDRDRSILKTFDDLLFPPKPKGEKREVEQPEDHRLADSEGFGSRLLRVLLRREAEQPEAVEPEAVEPEAVEPEAVEPEAVDWDELAQRASTVLREAFAAVRPDGRPVLALYVYGRCLDKWERSEDYRRITIVLHALRDMEVPPRRKDSPAAEVLLGIIKSQAQHVVDAMDVEEAMNCSCAAAMSERAGRVVSDLAGRAGLAGPAVPEKLGDGFDDLRVVVWTDARTSWSYFRAIKDIADAVPKLVEGGAPGAIALKRVKEKLNDQTRANALVGDVYESELLPHRALLDALDDQSEAPRLRIDAAELVYVYPFALKERKRSAEARDTTTEERSEVTWVDIALEKGVRLPWPDDKNPLQLETVVLERNDVWERPDVIEPGYSGASAKLPNINLTTTDCKPVEFEAEVRLSQLGNHYVRVRSPLADAGLNELNKALRRGSPAMGAESLTWEHQPASDDECEKFTDYATDLIERIAGSFDAKPVLNLDAQFHVIVAARSISVDGKSAPSKLTDLTGWTEDGQRVENPVLGASLLFHPIRHLATSLEEWVRYPTPRPDNLLKDRGYTGDLVVRTENTTVSYMPTSPDWLTAEYQELIEFVASIPPLFSLSEERAKDATKRLDSFLGRSAVTIDREVLYEHETDIRILESEIRQLLATLHSPALCRTGGQREFLDDLWDAAGLPSLESALERQLTLLADRQQRIATLVRREQQQRREERNDQIERPVKLVAVVLGVASFAEVLSLINQVWGEGEGGIQGPLATAIELGVLLSALVLVLWLLRSSFGKTR